MQHFDTAYSIEYFTRTIECGKYQTIVDSMKEEFGEAVEVPYQLIDQKDILPKVWQQARQMADEKFSNPNSREYKRTKSTHTPVGLVVYVGNKSLTKKIKRKIV